MSATEIAPGLWRWTARHPAWHPADAFGAEVASFALVAGDTLLLVDPLLPDETDDADAVLATLDALAAETKDPHILAPTLAPLGDLPAQRILTTHGAPILHDGAAALATALDAEPWFHHG